MLLNILCFVPISFQSYWYFVNGREFLFLGVSFCTSKSHSLKLIFTEICKGFSKSPYLSQVFSAFEMLFSFFKHMLSFFYTAGPQSLISVNNTIELAKQRVQNLLSESGTSLHNICLQIERAENMVDLKVAFARLNKIIGRISLIAPLNEQNGMISQILKDLTFSDKFSVYLNSASSPHQAIKAYKTAVVQELADHVHKLENFSRTTNSFEHALFSGYFSEGPQPAGVQGTVQEQLTDLSEKILSTRRKRTFSNIMDGDSALYVEGGPDTNQSSTNLTVENPIKKKRFHSSSH